MAMFHLLKIRTSIDIFTNEKCKVTFGLEYIYTVDLKWLYGRSRECHNQTHNLSKAQ